MPTATALVTGATGGIGSAVAVALAGRGASLVLSGRREPELQRVVARCVDAGGEAVGLPADLAARGAAAGLAAEALERLGSVELLVHAAGIPCRRSTSSLEMGDVEQVTAVNYLAAAELVLALLPHMRARGRGDLVMIGSVAGRVPAPREAAYSASKHALAAFTDVLAMELEGSGVRPHLVTPGVVETPLWDDPEQEPASVRGFDVGPDAVARSVLALVEDGRYEAYVPRRYRAAAVLRPVLGRWFLAAAARFDRARQGRSS